MALQSNKENGISRLLGDNTAENINLSPEQLTNIPGGVLALGGNDTVIGSADSELILGNQGQDIIRGGEGNDTLYGGKDSDQLFGDTGDDFLSGDRGIDTLTGGQGRDRFALSTGGGSDIITDFDNANDFIQVPAGVSISDILIQAAGANTLITLKSTGEQLAQLNNVQASSVTNERLLLPNQALPAIQSPAVNTSPSAVNTSPSAVNTSPSAVNTSPSAVNTSPSAVNTSPPSLSQPSSSLPSLSLPSLSLPSLSL
jgi:Ca2+-binding RTX toxin-like protein